MRGRRQLLTLDTNQDLGGLGITTKKTHHHVETSLENRVKLYINISTAAVVYVRTVV